MSTGINLGSGVWQTPPKKDLGKASGQCEVKMGADEILFPHFGKPQKRIEQKMLETYCWFLSTASTVLAPSSREIRITATIYSIGTVLSALMTTVGSEVSF